MAKGNRKRVYNSSAWEDTKKYIWLKQNCLCANCGKPVYVSGISPYLPKEKRRIGIVHHKEYLTEENCNDLSIAYAEENLIGLCIDCHNEIHKPNVSVKSEYTFDELGNLIRK